MVHVKQLLPPLTLVNEDDVIVRLEMKLTSSLACGKVTIRPKRERVSRVKKNLDIFNLFLLFFIIKSKINVA
jgi:hypothetical protein